VCSLRHLLCNAHASYYRLWPLRLHEIFKQYPIKDTISEKEVLNIKCLFWLSVHVLSKYFYCKKKLARYDQKCILVFIKSARHFCSIKKILNILDRFSKNKQISNITKIRSMEAKLFYADRRMDRTKLIAEFATLRTRLKIATFQRLRSLPDTERKAHSFCQESDSHYSFKNWNGTSVSISRQRLEISFLHNH
jgi:hypothetical protein